jgi:hypothetical protein
MRRSRQSEEPLASTVLLVRHHQIIGSYHKDLKFISNGIEKGVEI